MKNVCYFIKQQGHIDLDNMKLTWESIEKLYHDLQTKEYDPTRKIRKRTITEEIVHISKSPGPQRINIPQ